MEALIKEYLQSKAKKEGNELIALKIEGVHFSGDIHKRVSYTHMSNNQNVSESEYITPWALVEFLYNKMNEKNRCGGKCGCRINEK